MSAPTRLNSRLGAPSQQGTQLNVRVFGAMGDGIAVDTNAFSTAQIAINTAGQGTLLVPPGTYKLDSSGIVLRASNMTIQGASCDSTTLTGSIANLIQSSAAFPKQKIVIEDLGFDLNTVSANGITINGGQVQEVTIRRCRFRNCTSIAIGASRIQRLTIEDCIFETPGTGDGTGISLGEGLSHVTIRRNRFRWLSNGIVVDTGSGTGTNRQEEMAEFVRIEDNDVDLGWWMLPVFSGFTNSGGTVTYTGTVLTDSAAAFSGISTSTVHNVRAMPVRHAGTITAVDATELTDSGATFSGYSILRGEIVRSGTRWSYIAGVDTVNNKLRLEEWLDSTTYAPTTPPTPGDAYTVYGIYIGRTNAFTGTTITTDRWHDLAGTTVTPGAGTLYEVPRNRPNYPLQIEYNARSVLVSGNLLRRGWSDQCSVYCDRATITNNIIEDGQDTGITSNGSDQIISANRIHHQGAMGIYHSGNDSVIQGNVVTATQWQNAASASGLIGGINIHGANGGARNLIHGNVVDGESQPQAYAGITVRQAAVDNRVFDNDVRNHSIADITIADVTTTGTRIRGQSLTIQHLTSAVGGVYDLTGAGSPASVVTAGVGSRWWRTDGGASTTFYLKESGTDTSGWRAV